MITDGTPTYANELIRFSNVIYSELEECVWLITIEVAVWKQDANECVSVLRDGN